VVLLELGVEQEDGASLLRGATVKRLLEEVARTLELGAAVARDELA
jgi:hypothetical protein